MRTLSLFAAVLVCSISITEQVEAQSPLEISPDPTSANDLITLTIDVSQSSQHGLKTILQSNPDLPVYIWTWSPSDPIAGLGSWDNSNEDMRMTHEGGMKYSIQFTPSEWYQDVTNFYTNGISCLAKLKNGVDPTFEDIGEAKTEDFNIVPNAPVCDDLICVFPEGWRSDEFVTFRFFPFNDKDSSLYLVDPATGIEAFKMFDYDGPAKLQIVARATDGQFYPAAENLESTLIDMDPMENYPRAHQITIYPPEFFAGILPEGESLYSLFVYPVIEGSDYPPPSSPGLQEQEYPFAPPCDD